jgi:2-C-methyl-D-erythritol 4-phosphate cytidylyltransferase
MSKKFAIIVAGGSGSRMQTELPKQFLLIHNKPILMYSIEKFAMDDIEIILVLNVDYHEYWQKLCAQYSFTIPHVLVQGGRNRFESVKNGLKHVSAHSIVAVHDAVRPLIKQERIKEAFAYAETHGNAVISVRSKDSIRRVQEEHSTAVPRDEYYLIQTPQVFQSELLIKAYKEEFRNEFTDDASVVERSGVRINLIEGDYSNLKITFPEDLLFAESLLK